MPIKVSWSEIYAHPLPEGHRFPMEKYDLLPTQLKYEGTLDNEHFFSPAPLDEEYILAVHSSEYWKKLSQLKLTPREQRVSGFPHSTPLIERERIICNGTLLGAEMALKSAGCALNVAGGTHHAFTDRAEGFCLLNDIAIAAAHLLKTTSTKKILVVDLDVHQGNGTASIFENDERVFTFSMHGAKNYPFKKEHSDLDIALKDGIDDQAYLDLLKRHLLELMETVKPDFVFYQSGVDILSSDKLGKLGVSLQGCKQRDELVISTCLQKGIPMQISMGGGYSKDIKVIVEAHANTFRLAKHYFD